MILDDKKYKLPHKNYLPIESKKSLIVVGNTFNSNMRHVFGWLHRFNGNYKKTAAFTIGLDGIVYKHFEPKFISNFLNTSELNNKSIVILLENVGPLVKNKNENNFIGWNDDIYNENNGVFEKKWRGSSYWAPYTDEQISSLIELVCMLCDRFEIPLNSVNHNTKLSQTFDFKGVLYKSNLEKFYNDPNPNLNYELIKTKIEEYERKY